MPVVFVVPPSSTDRQSSLTNASWNQKAFISLIMNLSKMYFYLGGVHVMNPSILELQMKRHTIDASLQHKSLVN